MQLDKLLNNACKIISELESLIQKHRVDELLDYNMDKKIDKFFKDVNNLNETDMINDETCPTCDQHPYSETDNHCPVCFMNIKESEVK